MEKIDDIHKIYLPIQSIRIQYNRSPHNYAFYMNRRRESFSISYLIKGSVTFYTPSKKITFREGDMSYVPYGIRYRSEYDGENGSEYISIYGYPANRQSQYIDNFALQKIEEFSNSAGYEMLLDIYNTAKNEQNDYAVFEKFSHILSTVRPCLKEEVHNDFPKTLIKAIDYIENHYSEQLSIPDLAARLSVSESTLYHLFKKELSITPVHYFNLVRLEKVMDDMNSDEPIEAIAYRHGFSSYSYFRELFKSHTGMTPKQYRTQKLSFKHL